MALLYELGSLKLYRARVFPDGSESFRIVAPNQTVVLRARSSQALFDIVAAPKNLAPCDLRFLMHFAMRKNIASVRYNKVVTPCRSVVAGVRWFATDAVAGRVGRLLDKSARTQDPASAHVLVGHFGELPLGIDTANCVAVFFADASDPLVQAHNWDRLSASFREAGLFHIPMIDGSPDFGCILDSIRWCVPAA